MSSGPDATNGTRAAPAAVRPLLAPAVVREATMRAIFDATFQFTGLLTPDGTLVEVNRTALDFVDVERDAVIGRPFWETPWWRGAAPRDIARLRRAVADAARGAFVRYEAEVRGADGQVVTIDFSLKPLLDEDDRVVCVIPEGRDVTEQRRAQEALRRSEARLAAIVSLAADAIVSVDADQRILLFNQAAERTFGYLASEVVGRPLDVLLPALARAAHHLEVEAILRGPVDVARVPHARPVHGQRRDGSEFPADVAVSRVDVDGERMLTMVVRDVTERRRDDQERARLLARETAARTAAEAAERRAAFLAEAAMLLDERLDPEATVRSLAQLVVPALATFCLVDLVAGGDVRRVVVEHADAARREAARELERYPRDPREAFARRTALRTGTPLLVSVIGEAELRRMAYDDEHLALLRALEPASYMDVPLVARGAVIGAVAFVHDARSGRHFTPADLGLAEDLARRAALALDNARLYDTARRAARSRDEVLGVISHDLRTPLAAVGMHLRAIEACGDALTPEAHAAADAIRESIAWQQRLIEDLLDVASLDAGRLRLRRRHVDPVVLVLEAVELLQPIARDAGVHLAADVPEELPPILADHDRLMQVLANLVGNAVKFTPAGGTVTIAAAAEGDTLALRVSDTGCGIAPEELPHVFERFWRGGRGAPGVGLGLAIARELVVAHGGRIEATSTPGAGTTMHVRLPLALPDPMAEG